MQLVAVLDSPGCREAGVLVELEGLEPESLEHLDDAEVLG